MKLAWRVRNVTKHVTNSLALNETCYESQKRHKTRDKLFGTQWNLLWESETSQNTWQTLWHSLKLAMRVRNVTKHVTNSLALNETCYESQKRHKTRDKLFGTHWNLLWESETSQNTWQTLWHSLKLAMRVRNVTKHVTNSLALNETCYESQKRHKKTWHTHRLSSTSFHSFSCFLHFSNFLHLQKQRRITLQSCTRKIFTRTSFQPKLFHHLRQEKSRKLFLLLIFLWLNCKSFFPFFHILQV
jgi:hypothetical protein